MNGSAPNLAAVKADLILTPAQVTMVAERFHTAMVAGLAGKPSPLKMLPSYLTRPAGSEQGLLLALDFGGSNVRVQQVELCGQGRWLVRRNSAALLKDPAGEYDYTAAAATAEQLFDFLADRLAGLVDDNREYLLGHTFSFPCRQPDAAHAVLIGWTKEIATSGIEGREIGALLQAALDRRGLSRIKPCAIINDTVGTLLAAAYADPRADIAAICGTGHNTCYFDRGRNMIINIESGNFDVLPFTRYDDRLDAASERPGAQRLEKMAAGRYLGELVRLIATDLGESVPASLTTAEVSTWLTGRAAPAAPAALREIAMLVIKRAARLVAATFLGVLAYNDPRLADDHVIAVDGSLYEKLPRFAGEITACLGEALGDKAARVRLVLTKDGSGAGAAVAAAVVTTRRWPPYRNRFG